MTVNIGWGSGNGFTNLTGPVTVAHVHGPTDDAAPLSFSQNAGILIDLDNLPGFNSSATNGGFSGTLNIAPANVSDLFEGRLYINIHTQQNPPGEIRGQLIPIPEPGFTGVLGLLSLGLVAARRRRD